VEKHARKIIINEALSGEATQKALNQAVRKVQLHAALIDALGSLEDNRAYGRLLAPSKVAATILRQWTQAIQCGGP
jgi:hypothetical protein